MTSCFTKTIWKYDRKNTLCETYDVNALKAKT